MCVTPSSVCLHVTLQKIRPIIEFGRVFYAYVQCVDQIT